MKKKKETKRLYIGRNKERMKEKKYIIKWKMRKKKYIQR